MLPLCAVSLQAVAGEYPTDPDRIFTSAPTDRKGCLEACDDEASCVAVFVTQTPSWGCYRVDGDFSTTGTVVSAAKAEPTRINLNDGTNW